MNSPITQGYRNKMLTHFKMYDVEKDNSKRRFSI